MFAVAIALCALYVVGCLCLGAPLRRLLAGRSAAARVDDTPAAGRVETSASAARAEGSSTTAAFEGVSPTAAFVTSFLLGQGALAIVWQLLALFAWLSPPVVAAGLALCIIAGAKFAWADASPFARRLRAALAGLGEEPWPWKVLAGSALLLLLVKGAAALLPPEHVDAVSFYLAIAKATAASHRLVSLPGYELFTQVGLQGEFHFAALMSLGSARAATLFLWSTGVAAACMLLAVCSEVGVGRRGKIVALAALATSTAFTNIMADGKVDLFGAVMGLAAFYWALRAADEGRRGASAALRLAGLFTGLAVVAKISYLPVMLPAVLLLVCWGRWRRAGAVGASGASGAAAAPSASALWPAAAAALALGLWAALPLVPHLFKNAVLFGEPLLPFVGSQGKAIVDQTWFSPEATRKIVLTYPLVMAFGRYPMQYGNLSPLVLALAPLALLLPRPKDFFGRPVVRLTLAAAVGVGAWLLLRPAVVAPRYILAPLLLFIPAAAYAAERISRRESRPRLLGPAVIVSLLYVTLSTLNLVRAVPATLLRYETGRVSECDVGGPECRVLQAVNAEAQAGARVYLATYPRYWLRPDLLQCVSTVAEMVAAESKKDDAEARWSSLYERGFRYVVTDAETHAQTAQAFDPAGAPGWLSLTTVLSDERFMVLRLEGRDPARRAAVQCRQARPPAWDVVGAP